ncbi:MAG: hypothetical protein ACRESS_02425 [Stenotrophobium sp.]
MDERHAMRDHGAPHFRYENNNENRDLCIQRRGCDVFDVTVELCLYLHLTRCRCKTAKIVINNYINIIYMHKLSIKLTGLHLQRALQQAGFSGCAWVRA